MGDPRAVEILEEDKKLKCMFCNKSEINPVEWGGLYKLDKVVAHHFCLLFSASLVQHGNDDEGIWAFLPKDIEKERKRGNKLKCKFCKKNGATIGCNNTSCKTSYHYPCGYQAKCLFQFHDQFASYCQKHKPVQKIPIKTEKSCPICINKVDNLEDAIWPPCCGKSLFHRACIMNSARHAGYFFKCPLCNCKEKQFLTAMKANGVFIPDKDAAWELEPNAFQELLQSYSKCDVTPCLCPHGRDFVYNSEKSPLTDRDWKIVRCSTCGSSATHKKCSRLVKSIWQCAGCADVVKKLPPTQTNDNLIDDIADSFSDSGSEESDEDSTSSECAFELPEAADSDAEEAEILERLPFITNVFSILDKDDESSGDNDDLDDEDKEEKILEQGIPSPVLNAMGLSVAELNSPHTSIIVVPDCITVTPVLLLGSKNENGEKSTSEEVPEEVPMEVGVDAVVDDKEAEVGNGVTKSNQEVQNDIQSNSGNCIVSGVTKRSEFLDKMMDLYNGAPQLFPQANNGDDNKLNLTVEGDLPGDDFDFFDMLNKAREYPLECFWSTSNVVKNLPVPHDYYTNSKRLKQSSKTNPQSQYLSFLNSGTLININHNTKQIFSGNYSLPEPGAFPIGPLPEIENDNDIVIEELDDDGPESPGISISPDSGIHDISS